MILAPRRKRSVGGQARVRRAPRLHADFARPSYVAARAAAPVWSSSTGFQHRTPLSAVATPDERPKQPRTDRAEDRREGEHRILTFSVSLAHDPRMGVFITHYALGRA